MCANRDLLGFFSMKNILPSTSYLTPAVAVKQISKEKGRGLVATETIEPFSIILAEYPVATFCTFEEAVSNFDSFRERLPVPDYQITPQDFVSHYSFNIETFEADLWFITGIRRKSHLKEVHFPTHRCSDQKPQWALYSDAGYMNHDCMPNTFRLFGPHNIMIVKNMRTIHSGEEVTTSYASWDRSLSERRKILDNQWGFHCQCLRCSRETLAVNSDVRNSILRIIDKLIETEGINPPPAANKKRILPKKRTQQIDVKQKTLAKLETLVTKAEATYVDEDRTIWAADLAYPLYILAIGMESIGNKFAALHYWNRLLGYLGYKNNQITNSIPFKFVDPLAGLALRKYTEITHDAASQQTYNSFIRDWFCLS